MNYVSKLLKSKTAPEVLPFFLPHKHAEKEITESWACLEAAKRINYPLDHNTTVIIPGDGKKPRTGALFAFFTKCGHTYSIDPEMDDSWDEGVERFTAVQDKLERIENNGTCHGFPAGGQDRMLLVLPHSHAPMDAAVRSAYLRQRLDIIAMPCCKDDFRQFLTMKNPAVTYIDRNVLSPKNQIYIWTDYRTEKKGRKI